MTARFTTEDCESIKSEWQQQQQLNQKQQLNPIPNLLNTFLEESWTDSETMMNFMMATKEPLPLSVMQDYVFNQMRACLSVRQRLCELLEIEDQPIEYNTPPHSSTSSLPSSLNSNLDSNHYSDCSSSLGSTPLLTSYHSNSDLEIQSITQDQEEEKKKEEEEESLEKKLSSVSSDARPPLKLSLSPSMPTLGKSDASNCCDGNFLPTCNYLYYYPNNNINNDNNRGTCHICNEFITPLKRSFSVDDFSSRQLDDNSSCCMSDESTINKVEEFQPLIDKVGDDDDNYHFLTSTTSTEDQQDEFEYKHLSSFTKQSNDSLDSIIQKHQEIISSQMEKKKDRRRRSMFGIFSHKKITSFFSLKRKKVASSYSFHQKEDMSVLI